MHSAGEKRKKEIQEDHKKDMMEIKTNMTYQVKFNRRNIDRDGHCLYLC